MNGEFWCVRTLEQKMGLIKRLGADTLDKPLYISIGNEMPRTKLQNRYLFGWVYRQIVDFLDDSGIVIRTMNGGDLPYTKEILHEIMREKYLVIGEIAAHNGKILKVHQSSANLKKKPFAEFVDNVKKFASQFWACEVADPHQGMWLSIYNDVIGRKGERD